MKRPEFSNRRTTLGRVWDVLLELVAWLALIAAIVGCVWLLVKGGELLGH
jgi:hypothetical protein